MPSSQPDFFAVAEQIKLWSKELGFQQAGISDTRLTEAENHLNNWLEQGFHGDVGFAGFDFGY